MPLLIKTKTFSFVALVLLSLFSPNIISSVSASTSSNNRLEEKDGDASNSAVVDENEPVSITAREYCEFLNAVAADDPHHLYNEKLREDSAAPCIQRSGSQGHYSYVVAVGEEKKDLVIDALSAMRYCNWLSASHQLAQEMEDRRWEIGEITEHGVYEIQNDQLISINSEGSYFIADDDGPLSLANYNDNQLYSSCSNFHVMAASSLNTKKNSGKGKTGSSLQKVEEGMIVAALLAGGGERGEALEQARRGATREEVILSLNTHADGSTPRLMMNPSSIVERRTEEAERILGIGKNSFTDGSIGRSAVRNRTDIAKFTTAKPRLLGGGPKQDPTKKSPQEASEEDDLTSLTLEDFRNAVAAHPAATRLIIGEDQGMASIQPPDRIYSNKDPENQRIMRKLKNLIATNYSPEIANGIPELSPMAFVSAKDLSAVKVREILERCKNSHRSAAETFTEKNSGGNDSSWKKCLSESLGIAMAIAGDAGERPPLTLHDFKNAAATHLTATRFIIREEASNRIIVPTDLSRSNEDSNRSENRKITQALRTALARVHQKELLEGLLPLSDANLGDSLTRKKLSDILLNEALLARTMVGRTSFDETTSLQKS